jgi:hypothetical protein
MGTNVKIKELKKVKIKVLKRSKNENRKKRLKVNKISLGE